jgi:hypothetical protein
MAKCEVYSCIVKGIKSGSLQEPFTAKDFKKACPNFGKGTYNAFLWKHRVGNKKKLIELFVKVSPGKFKLVRPLEYGLDL